MSNQPNNATVVDSCTKRLQALKTYVDAKAQIAINGKKHKLADVVAMYQGCLNSRADLATKRSEVKAAMASRASSEQVRRVADRALKAWVTQEFGVESQQAIDFGFPPPKKAARNVGNKAKAVAQAQATRTARHTMGKKQKLSIKGTVLAPTAPAAPATNTLAGASPASQPATPAAPAAAPQQPSQSVNGAPAPAAAAATAPSH
jgi:hypothetical protein